MNVTPYANGSVSYKKPFESSYDDPVYDVWDANDDGQIDNPGNILYEIPTRTGQKDNYTISLGVSATWSKPLDKTLQELCKEAASTQIGMQKQLTANKRLDFEIARLKNCGELMKAGIMFHPRSKFAVICSDVIVVNPPGVVANHTHGLQPEPKPESVPEANGTAEDLGTHSVGTTTSSSGSPDSPSPSSSHSSPSSSPASEVVVPSSSDTHSSQPQNVKDDKGFFQGWRLPWSKPALSPDETPSAVDQLGVLQVGHSLQPPSQSQP